METRFALTEATAGAELEPEPGPGLEPFLVPVLKNGGRRPDPVDPEPELFELFALRPES